MDVLGAESVFVAVLEEPLAGINHEDAVSVIGTLFVNYEDTSGDPSAVEQIGG